MKLGYLYGMKIRGNVDLGTDPYTGLPSTLNAPGGITPRTAGDIFFVDGFNGDNDNDGLSKDTPFLTITYALTQCANNNDDVIFVLDGWNTEPDYPVVVTKTRVHIIGLSATGLGGKYVALTPSTADDPVFQIAAAANGSEIAGFSLGGGATSPCIYLVNPMDVWIHDCWFGNQYHGVGTPQDGISNMPGMLNPSNCLIENCRFFGSPGAGVGGITRYGIYNNAGAISFRNSAIIGCRFDCMSYAIRLVYAADFLVEHNYIMCPSDDVVGRGIHVTGGVGGIIANNKAGDNGTADMGFNPYYDNVLTANAWLCNQNGKTYTMPV